MGLDVYISKGKSKESILKYISANNSFYEYEESLYTKYKKEVTENYKAYEAWMDEMDEKFPGGNYDLVGCPLKDIDEFLNKKEKFKYLSLKRKRNYLKLKAEIRNIEDLYMRKFYPIVQWIYSRHKGLIKHTKEYNNNLKYFLGYGIILDRKDITALISKLKDVIENCPRIKSENTFIDSNEFICFFDKRFLDKVFPIKYTYHFNIRLEFNYMTYKYEYLYKSLKNTYKNMKDNEVLLYEESW